jgi:hypothetical protein
MAPRKSATKKAAVALIDEGDERDYESYATKDVNAKAEVFSEWLAQLTGYDEIDPRSVMLAINLHAPFQASTYWKEHEDNPRAQNGEAEAPTKVSGKKPARGKAATKVAEPEEEDAEEEEEAPAPAKRRGRPASGKAAAAKPAATRRPGRPRSKPAASDDEEAPY